MALLERKSHRALAESWRDILAAAVGPEGVNAAIDRVESLMDNHAPDEAAELLDEYIANQQRITGWVPR